MSRRLFIAGNWKMNKTVTEAIQLADALKRSCMDYASVDIAVAPTSLAIGAVSQRLQHTNIFVSAQHMHQAASGAYTGEISGEMIRSAGAEYVIIGHSERRSIFGETDNDVQQKIDSAFKTGLLPILCVGETLEERESGSAFSIVMNQLKVAMANLSPDQAAAVTIAYEPVWAIGTGKTATPDQAQQMHAEIRQWLLQNYPSFVAKQVRIQYGGSVKPHNAAILLSQPDVDGALVGGAALNSDSFTAIVKAAEDTNKV